MDGWLLFFCFWVWTRIQPGIGGKGGRQGGKDVVPGADGYTHARAHKRSHEHGRGYFTYLGPKPTTYCRYYRDEPSLTTTNTTTQISRVCLGPSWLLSASASASTPHSRLFLSPQIVGGKGGLTEDRLTGQIGT